MPSIADMNLPNGAADADLPKQLNLKCVNCIHFKSVPAFQIGGANATCGSKLIGRAPGDEPCPHFNFDSLSYLRLPGPLRMAIARMMHEIEKNGPVDGLPPELVVVAGALASYKLRKRGLRFGGQYKFVSGGKTLTGILLMQDRSKVILMDVETQIKHSVPQNQIEYVPRRQAPPIKSTEPVAPVETSKPAAPAPRVSLFQRGRRRA